MPPRDDKKEVTGKLSSNAYVLVLEATTREERYCYAGVCLEGNDRLAARRIKTPYQMCLHFIDRLSPPPDIYYHVTCLEDFLQLPPLIPRQYLDPNPQLRQAAKPLKCELQRYLGFMDMWLRNTRGGLNMGGSLTELNALHTPWAAQLQHRQAIHLSHYGLAPCGCEPLFKIKIGAYYFPLILLSSVIAATSGPHQAVADGKNGVNGVNGVNGAGQLPSPQESNSGEQSTIQARILSGPSEIATKEEDSDEGEWPEDYNSDEDGSYSPSNSLI